VIIVKAGIYCIENLINGKKYIGQGINVEKRMFGNHIPCVALDRAIKKHGKRNFKTYVILYCEPEPEELDYYEIECIKIFHSHVSQGGYNISWGGDASMRGRKHSKKTKQQMSELKLKEKNNMFGKHHSEKVKQQMSEAHLGIHLPDKAKQRMSKAHLGKHHSDETIRKMSKAKLREKNFMFGKHHSEKTKQQMSKARLKYWKKKKN